MNNKEFDDIIKKKLESLNTEGGDDAWDLFKEKWDNESNITSQEEQSQEDQILDEKIKTDMQKLRIPFNSKHWIILKEQLELEALFKKKLFVAKSVELVILAFIVLGILNVWPIQKDIYQIPVYDIPMVASVPVDKETAEIHEAREEARLAQRNALKEKIYSSTKKLATHAISSIDDISASLSTIAPQNTQSPNENSIQSSSLDQNTDSEVHKDVQMVFPFISPSIEMNSKVNLEKQSIDDHTDDPIAYLIPTAIKNLEIPKRPTGYPDISLKKKEGKKKENTYVSFALGPKMNLINSPFDPIYEIDPYNIINTNFNISAKVHKEVGPIELYAGLGYTNTSYEPKIYNKWGEKYESVERQYNLVKLENIKFKTFNVPVGVHYNVIDSKNMKVYATAGVDMNVIADSEYEIEDIAIGSSGPRPLGPPPSSPPGGEKGLVNTNADLSQKEFNKGILSGGSLKDNLYATANVGLGLNWNISSRSGIFIEPKYSHFISSKGIGPNEDKVHGVSVDLGFKYLLN